MEMEAERDSATSRARQLQKAVAQSEEGESDPGPLLCSRVLLAAELEGCGIALSGSCIPALATVTRSITP